MTFHTKFFDILNRFITHYDVERSYQVFLDFSKHNRLLTLDVGCGDGWKSSIFKKIASEVVGLDISVEKLSGARERGVQVVLADALHLPFKDDCFGAVTCFHVIEHLTKSAQALIEIRRVLRIGGILLLTTPNSRRITCKIGSLFLRRKTGSKYPLNPNHYFEYDERSLMNVAQNFQEAYVIPIFIGLGLGIEMKFPTFFKKYCD